MYSSLSLHLVCFDDLQIEPKNLNIYIQKEVFGIVFLIDKSQSSRAKAGININYIKKN